MNIIKLSVLKKSVVGYIVGWTPEYFGCLGYIVSCGYPTRTRTHTRGNSVAHVCSLYSWRSIKVKNKRHTL